MNYLERNAHILQEVGQQLQNGNIRRGDEVGKSTSSVFTSIGSYKSSFTGEVAYVGIKESRRGVNFDMRSKMDLAKIAVMAKYSPSLLPFLPTFHGSLVGKNGKTIILTEDFSKGGSSPVKQWPLKWADMPDLAELSEMNSDNTDCLRLVAPWFFLKDEVLKLDSALKDEAYDLTSMCFIADGRLRLGDFDKMFFGRNLEQILQTFPLDCTFLDFLKYVRENQLQFTKL